MAGFGASSSSSNKKSKKNKKSSSAPPAIKLKPKLQWDRYIALKDSTIITAAVQKLNDAGEGDGDWIDVGYVKSLNDESVDIAVARQRALIAEHAKRLYPLQISAKDKVQWGYLNNEEYITITKDMIAKSNDSAVGFEKNIGFEGIADPQTGFYCHYKDGRIVNLNDSADKNFLSAGQTLLK